MADTYTWLSMTHMWYKDCRIMVALNPQQAAFFMDPSKPTDTELSVIAMVEPGVVRTLERKRAEVRRFIEETK